MTILQRFARWLLVSQEQRERDAHQLWLEDRWIKVSRDRLNELEVGSVILNIDKTKGMISFRTRMGNGVVINRPTMLMHMLRIRHGRV